MEVPMHRFAAFLIALLFLSACPPERTEEPDPQTVRTDGIWMVLTTSYDDDVEVSHSFVHWDGGPGLCSRMRQFYEEYGAAWNDYSASYDAFTETWSEAPEDDPDYRLAYCQLYEDFYGGLADAMDLVADGGNAFTYVDVSHPDQEEAGEPVEGTYPVGQVGDDDDADDDDLRALGNRIVYQDNPYDLLVAAYDCEAYAADPEADFPELPEEVYEDAARYYELVDGSLELAPESSDAWQLTLVGGVLEADIDGAQTDVEFDEGFGRCEISYELVGW